ncbi:hypothetical protein ACLI1A_03270 [Flavobacterium sp. RHBU_3]|uniref:hypothetical protein n=1 Tax=Flavobacterium sp. RHBU_3 TaxID=3391184 RepID=UPI003984778E
MKKIFLAVILLCSFAGQSQGLINKVTGKKSKVELYEEEPFNTELYQKYVGKVVFANSEINRNDPDSKYLTTYNTWRRIAHKGILPTLCIKQYSTRIRGKWGKN